MTFDDTSLGKETVIAGVHDVEATTAEAGQQQLFEEISPSNDEQQQQEQDDEDAWRNLVESLRLLKAAILGILRYILKLVRLGWNTSCLKVRHVWEFVGVDRFQLPTATLRNIWNWSIIKLRIGWSWRTLVYTVQTAFNYLFHRSFVGIIWLHEKTGIPNNLLVIGMGTLILVCLIFGIRQVHHHQRQLRKRGKQRPRSLSLADAKSARRIRDRGFSLDLDIGIAQTHAQAATQNQGIHFLRRRNTEHANRITDHLIRRSTTDPMHRKNTDVTLGTNTDMDFDGTNHQALQHGIGSGSPLNAHLGGTNSLSIRPSTPVTYHGPTATHLLYSTVTPPPSWTEAARVLLPAQKTLRLQREISLDLSKTDCLVTIRNPTASARDAFKLPVIQCSVHVCTPAIGGVLQIYVKESPKSEWMEHTFETASNAAQFQLDLLAIQIFGPVLHHMYQCLELVHQGSIACEGRECVCHHDKMSSNAPQGIGIPWDDAMRALGSHLPSIRIELERLWWHHYSMNNLRLQTKKQANKQKRKGIVINAALENAKGPVGDKNNPIDTIPDATTQERLENDYLHLKTDYVRKRLLIGPVDFFRLFVPFLPETALPSSESTAKRVEQLLRYRKRAATAALLTQAYVKARIVANHGWKLDRQLPTHYVTRRLAFDDNLDNTQRDMNVKNEVYEASVSRDIMAFVRPNEPNAFKVEERWWNWRPRKLRTVVSKYQVFTLVGFHAFKMVPDDDFPLRPEIDPVSTFGSLKEMIKSHPDVEFMVASFFQETAQTVLVSVYARTLPIGIDPAFDRNMSRYKKGNKETRDKKLFMMIQLSSPSETKTMAEVTTIQSMIQLMKSIGDNVDASTPTSAMGPSDRIPFPVIPVCRFGETRHFGGSLQKGNDLPQNYTSHTVHVDGTNGRYSIFSKLLLRMLEQGVASKNVVDVTYVLAAQEQDELPERALATFRSVRVEVQDIALPSVYVYGSHRPAQRMRSTQDANFFHYTTEISSMKNLTASRNSGNNDAFLSESIQVVRPSSAPALTGRRGQMDTSVLSSFRASIVPTNDPIEISVNKLIEILEDVNVPVRRDQLSQYEFSLAVPSSWTTFRSTNNGNVHNKDLINVSLLLLVTRGEIRRHFIASRCRLKKAAVRIVETAAWRGQTFPIDCRVCRIELQSGQFFQQGEDLEGRPVFYVRFLGLGPWRGNTEASVAALLHRFEGALHEFSKRQDGIQCTVVVLMGKPFKEYVKLNLGGNASTEEGDADGDDKSTESQMSTSVKSGVFSEGDVCIANPRVNPAEFWQPHTTEKLVRQVIDLLSAHYPERLYQALVVMKPAHVVFVSRVLGQFRVANFVDSPITRSKVKIVSKFSDLRKYVSKHELVTIVGGEKPIDPGVFGLLDE